MDARAIVEGLALTARVAARTLTVSTGDQRRQALRAIADEIDARTDEIILANARDIERAKADSMHPQMQDRLLLTRERIAGIADGARQVAALEDQLLPMVLNSSR
jgi:glutamate-5-semialdehyde dehydrogenase